MRMHIIYRIKIVVDFETSSDDYTKEFIWDEREDLDMFIERVKQGIKTETHAFR